MDIHMDQPPCAKTSMLSSHGRRQFRPDYSGAHNTTRPSTGLAQKQRLQITLLDHVCEALGMGAACSLINLYRGLCHMKALLYGEARPSAEVNTCAQLNRVSQTLNLTRRSAHKTSK